jgi:type 1 fimbria pilin
MSGTVTVPQSCEINPQPVNVDFGDILASKFKTKGAKPDNFTPINKQLTVACRNISQGVVIKLSFQATPDTNEPMALKTSNNDIGVIIEDRDGNKITPKSGTLPVTMDYAAQSGSTEMNVYPINTTGNTVAEGEFNATATIRAEIQ